MDGIEKIIECIAAEAEKQKEKLEKEYKEKLILIERARDEKIEQTVKGAEAEAEAERRRASERVKLRASTVSRDVILREKRKLIDRAFTLAVKSFETMDREKYLSVMGEMLREAFSAAEGKKVLCTSDGSVSGMKMAEKAGVRPDAYETSDKIKAGFILKTDGAVFDCTPEKLIESKREALEPLVTAALFG